MTVRERKPKAAPGGFMRAPRQRWDVEKILREGSYRDRGLLIANNFADYMIYRQAFLTQKQLGELLAVAPPGTRGGADDRQAVIDFEYRMRIFIGNIGTAYLSWRESMGHLTLFSFLRAIRDGLNVLSMDLIAEGGEKIRSILVNLALPFLEVMDMSGLDHGEEPPHLVMPREHFVSFTPVVVQLTQRAGATLDITKHNIGQDVSSLKAMLAAGRDYMRSKRVRILAYQERIRYYEKKIREYVSTFAELEGVTMYLIADTPDYDSVKPNEHTYGASMATLEGKDYGRA